MGKSLYSPTKKVKETYNRFSTSSGFSRRDRGKQVNSRPQATFVASVGSVCNFNKLECQLCNGRHFEEC